MVILTLYTIKYNAESELFVVQSKEQLVCPYCLAALEPWDTRRRSGIESSGEKRWYLIRRLECTGCGHVHTELPGFLHPYKQYVASAIQDELDEVKPCVCAADDSTMRSWRSQWRAAQTWMESALASLKMAVAHIVPQLIHDANTVGQIRRVKPKRWLAFVIRLLIGGGFPIYTKFAF